jgi:hypothetical protein
MPGAVRGAALIDPRRRNQRIAPGQSTQTTTPARRRQRKDTTPAGGGSTNLFAARRNVFAPGQRRSRPALMSSGDRNHGMPGRVVAHKKATRHTRADHCAACLATFARDGQPLTAALLLERPRRCTTWTRMSCAGCTNRRRGIGDFPCAASAGGQREPHGLLTLGPAARAPQVSVNTRLAAAPQKSPQDFHRPPRALSRVVKGACAPASARCQGAVAGQNPSRPTSRSLR